MPAEPPTLYSPPKSDSVLNAGLCTGLGALPPVRGAPPAPCAPDGLATLNLDDSAALYGSNYATQHCVSLDVLALLPHEPGDDTCR